MSRIPDDSDDEPMPPRKPTKRKYPKIIDDDDDDDDTPLSNDPCMSSRPYAKMATKYFLSEASEDDPCVSSSAYRRTEYPSDAFQTEMARQDRRRSVWTFDIPNATEDDVRKYYGNDDDELEEDDVQEDDDLMEENLGEEDPQEDLEEDGDLEEEDFDLQQDPPEEREEELQLEESEASEEECEPATSNAFSPGQSYLNFFNSHDVFLRPPGSKDPRTEIRDALKVLKGSSADSLYF